MDIRLLAAEDEPSLDLLMKPHKGYNIFILGNLLLMGWDNPVLKYWGTFTDGLLSAVLMRYRDNWTAWWNKPGPFISEYVGIIEVNAQATITGRPDVLEALIPPVMEVKMRYKQRLAQLDALILPAQACTVRWAVPEEVEELVELYKGDEVPRSRESLLGRIKGGGLAIGFAGGKMVTAAAVTATGRDSAMLGGVWTLPEHRNRGYGSWCTAWLCQELLNRGITPTLFYHNPAAGSIYRRMGFREIGSYAMATLFRP